MERNQRIEEELFPFYALDALTEEERAEVDGYVAGNPAAAARLAALMQDAADLTMATTTPLMPAPAVKAGLMARVAAESSATPAPAPLPPRPAPRPVAAPQPARRRWWSWGLAVGFAAAVLALILAGGAILNLNRQNAGLEATVAGLESTIAGLREETAGLQAEVGTLRTRNDELQDRLQAREDQLAAYLAPGAITIALGDISGEHPDAGGALTLHPDSGTATLLVSNLPPLDETQTYQAWLIADGTPVSAGTFNVDATGAATHAISGAAPGDFEAVGVSIEPAGGSDQPTPDQIILLAGLTS